MNRNITDEMRIEAATEYVKKWRRAESILDEEVLPSGCVKLTYEAPSISGYSIFTEYIDNYDINNYCWWNK